MSRHRRPQHTALHAACFSSPSPLSTESRAPSCALALCWHQKGEPAARPGLGNFNVEGESRGLGPAPGWLSRRLDPREPQTARS